MKLLLVLSMLVLVMGDNHDSDPFEGESCVGLLADDGAPLCSKAGQDEAQDFTEDMEDEIEAQMNEMIEFFQIDTETNYIRNAVCEEWSEPIKNLTLSTYY